LTLYTDICKPVRQVAPPAIGVASNTSSCGPCLETEAVFTCDLVTSTVSCNLSTSKCGHRSPVSWASFLPNFSSPALLFLTEGQARDRQMGRQTMAIGYQYIMPPCCGGMGIINVY